MLDLNQGECESSNMFSIYRLKKVRNDVYAEIEASKKDCLFEGLTYT